MNKTKVRVCRSLLDYGQAMGQKVHECREERLRLASTFDGSIAPYPPSPDITPTVQAGLLTAPRIEILWPELYRQGGQTKGLIQINTSDLFGILYVYVTLKDEAGNRLESGYAMRNEVWEGHWGYIPSVQLPVNTVVIVRALAVDALWGIGVAEETCTVEAAYGRWHR